MDLQDITKEAHAQMEKAIQRTQHEFNTLHTGKAAPNMVENLTADAYGSPMKVKDLAAITTPDAQTILINPWDKGMIQPIEKAVLTANIGLSPVIQGGSIFCKVPELSRERREELVKVASSLSEDGRIGVRAARQDALNILKAQKGNLSEDDIKRTEKEIQKETDNAIAKIAEILKKKEQELMQI